MNTQATGPKQSPGFKASLARRLNWKGFTLSVVLPGSWLLWFYALMAHVQLALGRWPNFGETHGGLLGFHETAVWISIVPLYFSVYAAAFAFVVCLFLRRWRHFSVYSLCYAAVFGLDVLAAFYLAPGPFLNWFWD